MIAPRKPSMDEIRLRAGADREGAVFIAADAWTAANNAPSLYRIVCVRGAR